MFLLHDDLKAMMEADWLATAVDYMIEIKLCSDTPLQRHRAFELAQTLWDNLNEDDEFAQVSPKDAVDEELTYWGD
jgi:hypothetical protein